MVWPILRNAFFAICIFQPACVSDFVFFCFFGHYNDFFISFQIPRWFFWILPGLFAFWSSATTSGFNIANEARELVMFGRSDARMLQLQIYKLYRYGPSPKYTNTSSDVRTSERSSKSKAVKTSTKSKEMLKTKA